MQLSGEEPSGDNRRLTRTGTSLPPVQGLPLGVYRTLAVVYAVSIAIALLNYGAVDIMPVALLALPIFCALTLAFWVWGGPNHVGAAIGAVLILWSVALVWVFVQSTSLPGPVWFHPAWSALPPDVAAQAATISLTPADDWPAFLRLSLPLAIFLLGLRIFDSDARAAQVLKLIAISGGLAAAAAIAQFITAPKTLLFAPKPAYFDSLTGFFVNRNTAATYFGIVAIVLLALTTRVVSVIDKSRILHAVNHRRPLAEGERRRLLRLGFYACLLLLTLIALMLTRSRAGIGASVVALTLFLFIHVVRSGRDAARADPFRHRQTSPLRRLLIAAAASAVAATGFLGIAGRALLRAEVQGSEDGRFCVLPGIVSAIVDYLPFGAGLSGFEAVFPAYRDPTCGISLVWDRAHSVYLEGMFTLGLVFPVLLLTGLGVLLYILAKGLRHRRSVRYAPEAGLAGLVLVILHSAFDFSLQISGLAIVFAAFLGPVVTICLTPPGGAAADGHVVRRRSSIRPR